MSVLSDERIKEIEGQVFHDSQPIGCGFELKVQRATAEAAYRETLKMVGDKIKFVKAGHPQPETATEHEYEPSYIMIDIKDWEALNKLEVSNGR